MKYTTKNSVYEVDEKNKQIRRVSGANPPTRHFSPNSEWKSYQSLSFASGYGVIDWTGSGHTVTSPLVSIETEEIAA